MMANSSALRLRAGAYLAVIPLILVNLVAVTGQLAFLWDHFSWGLPGDIAFAAALESIAVYLAYHAHIALIGNDSALRLRLASYAFGAVIGGMNYSHYAPRWHPTFQAVAVGLMSASSPWLWGIHSRRQSRAALMAAGLIEPHALRLGATRWLWHPLRSIRVMWFATWAGIQSPAEAIAAMDPQTVTHRAALEWRPEALADMKTQAEAIRYAMVQLARAQNVDIGELSPQEVAAWLQNHTDQLAEPWQIPLSYVYDVQRRTLAARAKANGNGKIRQLSALGKQTA